MKLQTNLVLFDYFTRAIGGIGTLEKMQGSDEGRRPDGQSNFYGDLESRQSHLVDLNLLDLKRYDLNILKHQDDIARHRPEFRLKYFQYLAALYTEIYLDQLSDTQKRVQFFLKLEQHRQTHFAELPPIEQSQLYKIAFWMATGAGKTLMLHLNLRQFQHYHLFQPVNILLITPTATLTEQHLNELHESGIEASYALHADPGYRGVQVLEITKLYVEGEGSRNRKSGDSLPTIHFEGPNLLLVDEGHKGTSTKSDREEERSWRLIRESLAEGGFTFEYSATFAQVTESNDELYNEYSRCILFEYAYRRFYTDGYGKDYWVINVKDEADSYSDRLLLAGLLTFYEKRRYYDDARSQLISYQITLPLFVFVGAQVNTQKSDVLEVIRFLDRVLRDRNWATQAIFDLLAGRSGLPSPNGEQDAFGQNSFPYLKQLAQTADQVYEDLCLRVFRGKGLLCLHGLKQSDGEIGLRTADSDRDAYCGVINVGAARDFLKKVQAETKILVGEDDHISDSLFEAINAPQSTISFLIGSKKFMEGWNSWRVSMMGLLKVGSNAGAQVVQLFGRGVRLKGKDSTLKRSNNNLPGTHPQHIQLLETLHIFGLKADYLKRFLDELKDDGIEPHVTRLLPIEVKENWIHQADLKGLALDGFEFKQQVIEFNPEEILVELDLNISVMVGGAKGSASKKIKADLQTLSQRTLALLSEDELFEHALTYKAQKGWENLYISRRSINTLLRTRAQIAASPEVLNPTRREHLPALTYAVQSILEKGLDKFYYLKQQQAETAHLQVVSLTADHPNIPKVELERAYQLQIPPNLLEQVEQILQALAQRIDEDFNEPLPRFHLDFHLYNPLLISSETGVKSVPTGLADSEKRFVDDLRNFWQQSCDLLDWQGYELYLLRNLPKRGIGFFQTAGFYPDFLLWLKQGEKQTLAFVDPKGLGRWDEEKVSLLEYICNLTAQVHLPLLAYIVTPTRTTELDIPVPAGEEKESYLMRRNVLLQQGLDYIQLILSNLKNSLHQ